MVLSQLGQGIQRALHHVSGQSAVTDEHIQQMIKEICGALLSADVNVHLVQHMRKRLNDQLRDVAPGLNKKKVVQRAVFDELVKLVDPGVEPFKPIRGKSQIFLFVGLQGAGKTTTCTKIAAHYQRKGWKVALVCADTYRAGAFDQLKQNATQCKIPFYGSYDEPDPAIIAKQGVDLFRKERFEIIIVDTSGRHKQEESLFDEMRDIADAVKPDTVLFVMDGTIGQSADAQARAFREAVPVGAVAITKMDSSETKGGGAISAVAATRSPILFIGTGEHPMDLERFNPRAFVSRMLGMGDLGGLMERVKDLKLDKDEQLMKKLEAGEFSIKDMYEQLRNIQKLGPLGKVMSMLPGIPSELVAGTEQEGTARLKKMMCIMDSMTDKELNSDGRCFVEQTTRVDRVARGSGVPTYEVEACLAQYRQFAAMVKKMGGNKGWMAQMQQAQQKQQRGGGRGPGMPGLRPGQMPSASQMQQMQQMASRMLPPGAMEQMGGAQGLQQMMQQMMGGGGGMGGLMEMAQQMMSGSGGGGGGMMEMMQQMMGGGGGIPSHPSTPTRKSKRK